jgi:hypothetical protein
MTANGCLERDRLEREIHKVVRELSLASRIAADIAGGAAWPI